MPAGSRPSGSRKLRKMGLLRTFGRPSRLDPMEKAVKIGASCVVKAEKRNSHKLQHGFSLYVVPAGL